MEYFIDIYGNMWATDGFPAQVYLDAYPDGTIHLPARPSVDHIWDVVAEAWVYVSPPDPITQWRETASLTKQEFCLALRDASVLNDADTKVAVNGGWPSPFLPALAGLNDPVKAEIIWAGATIINRNEALILVMQSYSLTDPDVTDLTDALVDSMFGWVE